MKKFFKKLAGVMTVVAVGACMSGCSCGDNTHTIVFKDATDNGESIIQWEGNNPITRPDDPSREGYVFGGWYVDDAYTIPYDFGRAITGDLTIYAKWIKFGTVTTPSTTLIDDGYAVVMRETEGQSDGIIFEDETVRFVLTLSDDYSGSSVPVLKVNGVEQQLTTTETSGTNTSYIYNYVGNGENVVVSVEGISIATFDLTLPQITGATIVSANGYSNMGIRKYDDYHFVLVADTGYDVSSAVVKVNGNVVNKTNGEYVISNIVSSDYVIEVSNILLQVINVTYQENGNEISNNGGSVVRLYNAKTSVVFGEDVTFNVQIVNAKYSQAMSQIAEYICVMVNGVEVDKTVTNGSVIVKGENINGSVVVDIQSNRLPVNSITATLPDTDVANNGYRMYIAGYKLEGEGEFTHLSDQSQRTFPYGTQLQIGVEVASEYIELAQSAEVYVIAKDKNGAPASKYNVKSGEQDYLIYTVRNDIEFSINSTYKVNLVSSDGVNYASVLGYSTDVQCFNTNSEIPNRTYKFRLNINELAYDVTNMSVEYYSTDASDTTVLVSNNGEYTISNISEDIYVNVKGVERKHSTVQLPTAPDGIESIAFSGKDVSSIEDVTYFDRLVVEVEISSSHNNYMGDVVFSVGDKATVTKLSTNGNIITFALTDISDNILSSDYVINGLYINSYQIILPQYANRSNYKLYNSSNEEIYNSVLTVNHGDSIVLQIVPNAMFNKDKDYVVTINGIDYDGLDTYMISLDNITENIEVSIAGIEEVNSYAISYYEADGITILSNYSTAVEHGDTLTLPDDYSVDVDDYHFDSWYIVELKDGVYVPIAKAEDGMIVDEDMVLIAVIAPDIYTITFVLTDKEGDVIPSISDNSANVNTEDGKRTFSIEDVKDKSITFDTTNLRRAGYTFDCFVLMEDITVKGTLIPAGTEVSSVGVNMLCDMKLKAKWKITVGYNDCNYTTLSEAIEEASYEQIDTIELYSSIVETGRIKIDKSVRIIGVDGNKRINLENNTLTAYDYQSFIYIDGFAGKTVDVYIENLRIGFSCTSNTDQATALLANNCNLELNNVYVSAEACGIVYRGNSNNSLKIVGGNIGANNNASSTIDRDFGLMLDIVGDNVDVSIEGTNFAVNSASTAYRAIYVKGSVYRPVLSLQDVVFESNYDIRDSVMTAIELEKDVDLSIDNVSVNSAGFVTWHNLIVENFVNEVEVNNLLEQFATSRATVQAMLQNNSLTDINVIVNRYDVLGDVLNHYLVADNTSSLEECIEFSNQGQLINCVSYGANMTYIKTGNLILSNSLVVGEDQKIDLNGVSLFSDYNITNDGSIINIGTVMEIGEGVTLTNNGIISSSNTEIYNYGTLMISEVANISVKTIINNVDANMINTGNVVTVDVNNVGEIVNNGSISISGAITNEDVVIVADDADIDVNNIVNNGEINISGEAVIKGLVVNNATGEINASTSSIVELYSGKIYNKGLMNILGSIVDNSIHMLVGETVNDYGISTDIVIDNQDGYHVVDGNVYRAQDGSAVQTMYPNGSGYYIGLVLYTGYNNANKNVTVKYTRYDDSSYPYSYVTKEATDVTDDLGRLELIIDTNTISGTSYLYNIVIEVTVDGVTNSYTLYFGNMNIVM